MFMSFAASCCEVNKVNGWYIQIMPLINEMPLESRNVVNKNKKQQNSS